MKILAINLFLCLVLSLNLHSQENPAVPETPTTQPAPKAPGTPQAPMAPQVPGVPQSPGTPQAPAAPQAPGAPQTPGAPQAPAAPEAPEAPEVPEVPEVPKAPSDPEEIEDEYDKDWNININIGNDDDNGANIRVGMLDMGISTYLNENNKLDMTDELSYMDQRLARSYNIGIHLVNIKLGLRKKDKPQNFGISTGIKWNIVHYSLEKDYAVSRNAERFQDGIDYNVPELRHNRLKANHLQLPLLLEFNSNPRKPSKSINVAAGIVYQLLLNSNYKYKTESGDKTKIKGDFNLAKSMALAEVRLGYGPLNFYVQYGPRLFQFLDGPYLKTLNIGVNIIPR